MTQKNVFKRPFKKMAGFTIIIKNRFLLLALLLLVTLLYGCKKDEKMELIPLEYSNYTITKNENRMPFQFAYSEKITDCKVTNINIDGDAQINYKFIVEDKDGKDYIYNGFYIYGILFEIKTEENLNLKSFDININNNFKKQIDLNMSIDYLDNTNVDRDILPKSIPFAASLSTKCEWMFTSESNIKIKSVEVVNKGLNYNKIEIDGKELIEGQEIEMYKDENFYITLFNNISEPYKKVGKGYVKICYEKNSEDFEYKSDLTMFGNTLELLEEKIGG